MKLKKVLFILLAVVTIGLFVACNDDVMANKDDSLNAYRVVESNGAFVYNGVKYETLQAALDAIASGKSLDKVITVTKSVVTPVATVADGQSVLLDLGGNTLTFYDVTQSALTIGTGTSFGIANGTLALQDTGNENLAVVYAKNSNLVNLSGVTINAKNQNALVADGVATVEVTGGSVVTGDTTVTGGVFKIGKDKEDTSSMDGLTTLTGVNFTSEDSTSVAGVLVETGSTLIVNNTMDAELELNGNTIIQVGPEGHATVTAMDTSDGKEVVSSQGTGAVTNNSGKTVPTEKAFAKITRDGVTYSYYGSLLSAVDSLDKDDLVIEAMANLECEGDITPAYSVKIALEGFDVTTTGTTGIVSEKALTITGTTDSEFNGYLNAAGITIDCVHVKGTVTSNGDMTTSSSVFDSAVNVTGTLTDGTVSEGPVYSKGSTFNETVEATGAIVLNNSTAKKNVASAVSVTAYNATLGESTSDADDDIYAPSITIGAGSTVKLNRLMESYSADPEASVPATSVVIEKTTGTIVTILAADSEAAVPVISVNNTGFSTGGLTITNVTAENGSISLTGYSDENLTVNGDVWAKAGAVSANKVTLKEDVKASTSFTANYSVVGDLAVSTSEYDADVVYAPVINISNSNLKVAKLIKGVAEADVPADLVHLENVYGTVSVVNVAASTAVDYTPNAVGETPVYYAFYLKNAFAEGDTNATVNVITAVGGTGLLPGEEPVVETVQAVYIDNASTANRWITGESVSATNGDIYIGINTSGDSCSIVNFSGSVSTTGTGNIELKGKTHVGEKTVAVGSVSSVGAIKTSYSVINGTASGASLEDGVYDSTKSTVDEKYTAGSKFHGAITVSGDAKFYNSEFQPATGDSGALTDLALTASTVEIGGASFVKGGKVVPYACVYDVTATKTDAENPGSVNNLTIVASTGDAGDLRTTGNTATYKSSIVVDNAALTSGTLSVSGVVAYDGKDTIADSGNVTLTSGDGSSLSVNGITGSDVTVTGPVTVNGTVGSATYPVATLTATSGTFKNDITASGAVSLTESTAEEDVVSATSVTATGATLGANSGTADDNIFAPSITITGASKLNLNKLSKNADTAADEVVLNITDTSASSIATVNTVKLAVTSAGNNLTVADTTATGDTTINSGTFTKTALSGTTEINNGVFEDGTVAVDHTLSGKTTITDGTFNGDVMLAGEDTNVSNTISGGTFAATKTVTYNSRGNLVITGGQFLGTTSIERGTGEVKGTCDKDLEPCNLYFAKLDIAVNEWYIRSAKIDVADLENLNVLVSKIVQANGSDYVYINYKASQLNDIIVMPNSSYLRVVLNFGENLVSKQTKVKIDSRVDLSGMIKLAGGDTNKLYSNRVLQTSDTTPVGIVVDSSNTSLKINPKDSGDPSYQSLYWIPNVHTVVFHSNCIVSLATAETTESQTFYLNEPQFLRKNTFERDHYIFKGWNTDKTGTSVKYADHESYEFTDPDLITLHLYAVWEPITRSISYTPDHCTFSGKRDTYIYNDTATTFTFNTSPDEGYTVTAISASVVGVTVTQHLDTNSQPVANAWDVNIPAGTFENIVLYASSTNTYNIVCPIKGDHYSVSVMTANSYSYNKTDDFEFYFKVVPSTGYEVDKDDIKMKEGSVGTATFTDDTDGYIKGTIAAMQKGDVEFTITPTPIVYDVTFAGTTEKYIVSQSDTTTAEKKYTFNTPQVFTITPSTGYMVTDVTVTGAESKAVVISDDKTTVTVPAETHENLTITATVNPKITYSLTNCSIAATSGDLPLYYDEGTEKAFSVTVTPDSGKTFKSFGVSDGVTKTGSDPGPYGITIPTSKKGEVVISAKAVQHGGISCYSVDGSFPPGCSFTPSPDYFVVGEASTVTLTAVAGSGYKISIDSIAYAKAGSAPDGITCNSAFGDTSTYQWVMTIPDNYASNPASFGLKFDPTT